jgi:hypothetical protein
MDVREFTSRFAEQIPMSAGRVSRAAPAARAGGIRRAGKLDRDVSHSAKGGDILNLRSIGHGGWEYLRVLNARGFGAREIEISKALRCSFGVSGAGANFRATRVSSP